jgi:hypothetical protein
MYYYPFYLQFINLSSFTYYNGVNENDMRNIPRNPVNLWSISRFSYTKYKGTKTFTASYNYYTKIYEFDGKKYASYDDVVNAALNI